VQVALDRVEFHFVPREPAQGTDDELLAQLVKNYIDPSPTVSSIPVGQIERENNRKYMLYRSELAA
jgi:hypothetical protein